MMQCADPNTPPDPSRLQPPPLPLLTAQPLLALQSSNSGFSVREALFLDA